MKKVTVGELMNQFDDMDVCIKDFEEILSRMSPEIDWEKSIGQCKRKSALILYDKLVVLRKERESFLETSFVQLGSMVSSITSTGVSETEFPSNLLDELLNKLIVISTTNIDAATYFMLSNCEVNNLIILLRLVKASRGGS